MKSEKEWINNLRNRMEGYSEPLPEGLWDKLSKELEEPKTPKVNSDMETVAGSSGSAGLAGVFPDVLVLVFSRSGLP